MTPTLTADRKADIREYIRDAPGVTEKELKTILIDPDVEGEFLTDGMIADLLKHADKPKRQGKYKAHRVARSKEQWRVLTNYPNYEVSNYGRVRCLQRCKADDWLKPRWKFKQKPFVVLYDKDGKRCEREVYWLMVGAGWEALKKPKPKSTVGAEGE